MASTKPSDKTEIIVLTYYSPSIFWFIPTRNLEKRAKFTDFLQKEARKFVVSDYPQTGQIVAVKSNWDKQFHRAQIIDVSEGRDSHSIAVIYIDDGFCERVPKVYDVSRDIAKVPPFSNKGMLGNLNSIKTATEAWSDGARVKVQELLDTPNVKLEFSKEYDFQGISIGDLYVTLPTKPSFSLAKYMCAELKCAIFNTEEFKIQLISKTADDINKIIINNLKFDRNLQEQYSKISHSMVKGLKKYLENPPENQDQDKKSVKFDDKVEEVNPKPQLSPNPNFQNQRYNPHQHNKPNQQGPNQHGPNQHGTNQYGPNQQGQNQHNPNQHNNPNQQQRFPNLRMERRQILEKAGCIQKPRENSKPDEHGQKFDRQSERESVLESFKRFKNSREDRRPDNRPDRYDERPDRRPDFRSESDRRFEDRRPDFRSGNRYDRHDSRHYDEHSEMSDAGRRYSDEHRRRRSDEHDSDFERGRRHGFRGYDKRDHRQDDQRSDRRSSGEYERFDRDEDYDNRRTDRRSDFHRGRGRGKNRYDKRNHDDYHARHSFPEVDKHEKPTSRHSFPEEKGSSQDFRKRDPTFPDGNLKTSFNIPERSSRQSDFIQKRERAKSLSRFESYKNVEEAAKPKTRQELLNELKRRRGRSTTRADDIKNEPKKLTQTDLSGVHLPSRMTDDQPKFELKKMSLGRGFSQTRRTEITPPCKPDEDTSKFDDSLLDKTDNLEKSVVDVEKCNISEDKKVTEKVFTKQEENTGYKKNKKKKRNPKYKSNSRKSSIDENIPTDQVPQEVPKISEPFKLNIGSREELIKKLTRTIKNDLYVEGSKNISKTESEDSIPNFSPKINSTCNDIKNLDTTIEDLKKSKLKIYVEEIINESEKTDNKFQPERVCAGRGFSQTRRSDLSESDSSFSDKKIRTKSFEGRKLDSDLLESEKEKRNDETFTDAKPDIQKKSKKHSEKVQTSKNSDVSKSENKENKSESDTSKSDKKGVLGKIFSDLLTQNQTVESDMPSDEQLAKALLEKLKLSGLSLAELQKLSESDAPKSDEKSQNTKEKSKKSEKTKHSESVPLSESDTSKIDNEKSDNLKQKSKKSSEKPVKSDLPVTVSEFDVLKVDKKSDTKTKKNKNHSKKIIELSQSQPEVLNLKQKTVETEKIKSHKSEHSIHKSELKSESKQEPETSNKSSEKIYSQSDIKNSDCKSDLTRKHSKNSKSGIQGSDHKSECSNLSPKHSKDSADKQKSEHSKKCLEKECLKPDVQDSDHKTERSTLKESKSSKSDLKEKLECSTPSSEKERSKSDRKSEHTKHSKGSKVENDKERSLSKQSKSLLEGEHSYTRRKSIEEWLEKMPDTLSDLERSSQIKKSDTSGLEDLDSSTAQVIDNQNSSSSESNSDKSDTSDKSTSTGGKRKVRKRKNSTKKLRKEIESDSSYSPSKLNIRSDNPKYDSPQSLSLKQGLRGIQIDDTLEDIGITRGRGTFRRTQDSGSDIDKSLHSVSEKSTRNDHFLGLKFPVGKTLTREEKSQLMTLVKDPAKSVEGTFPYLPAGATISVPSKTKKRKSPCRTMKGEIPNNSDDSGSGKNYKKILELLSRAQKSESNSERGSSKNTDTGKKVSGSPSGNKANLFSDKSDVSIKSNQSSRKSTRENLETSDTHSLNQTNKTMSGVDLLSFNTDTASDKRVSDSVLSLNQSTNKTISEVDLLSFNQSMDKDKPNKKSSDVEINSDLNLDNSDVPFLGFENIKLEKSSKISDNNSVKNELAPHETDSKNLDSKNEILNKSHLKSDYTVSSDVSETGTNNSDTDSDDEADTSAKNSPNKMSKAKSDSKKSDLKHSNSSDESDVEKFEAETAKNNTKMSKAKSDRKHLTHSDSSDESDVNKTNETETTLKNSLTKMSKTKSDSDEYNFKHSNSSDELDVDKSNEKETKARNTTKMSKTESDESNFKQSDSSDELDVKKSNEKETKARNTTKMSKTESDESNFKQSDSSDESEVNKSNEIETRAKHSRTNKVKAKSDESNFKHSNSSDESEVNKPNEIETRAKHSHTNKVKAKSDESNFKHSNSSNQSEVDISNENETREKHSRTNKAKAKSDSDESNFKHSDSSDESEVDKSNKNESKAKNTIKMSKAKSNSDESNFKHSKSDKIDSDSSDESDVEKFNEAETSVKNKTKMTRAKSDSENSDSKYLTHSDSSDESEVDKSNENESKAKNTIKISKAKSKSDKIDFKHLDSSDESDVEKFNECETSVKNKSKMSKAKSDSEKSNSKHLTHSDSSDESDVDKANENETRAKNTSKISKSKSDSDESNFKQSDSSDESEVDKANENETKAKDTTKMSEAKSDSDESNFEQSDSSDESEVDKANENETKAKDTTKMSKTKSDSDESNFKQSDSSDESEVDKSNEITEIDIHKNFPKLSLHLQQFSKRLCRIYEDDEEIFKRLNYISQNEDLRDFTDFLEELETQEMNDIIFLYNLYFKKEDQNELNLDNEVEAEENVVDSGSEGYEPQVFDHCAEEISSDSDDSEFKSTEKSDVKKSEEVFSQSINHGDEWMDNEAQVLAGAPICEKNTVEAGQCKCDTCKTWLDSNLMVFENGELILDEEKESVKEHPIERCEPLFKIDKTHEKIYGTCTKPKNLVCKFVAPKILIHGTHIPAPVYHVNEAPFNTSILRALDHLKYKQTHRIQSYSWPNVLRGTHTIIINGPGTGKTLAYVPPMCSTIAWNIASKKIPLNISCGPMSIILVPGVLEAECISSLICKLFQFMRNKPKVVFAMPPLIERIKREIKKGCDILICTPKILQELRKDHDTQLLRVIHIVLESAHELFKKFYSDVFDILCALNKVSLKRTFGHSVQLIMTSQHWTNEIKEISRMLFHIPLICIGAFVEAALYGKVNIKLTLAKSDDKVALLDDIMLRQKKVVILCNTDDEVDTVYQYLKNGKVHAIYLNSNTSIRQTEELRKVWENDSNPTILIASDSMFSSCFINVHNATMVIQYSLPKNWTTFTRRFTLFLDNYVSPIANTATRKYQKSVTQLFLDEKNSTQLGRMIDLIKRAKIPITDEILVVYQNFLIQKEKEKIDNKTELCEWLKLFGECSDAELCSFRHHLDKDLDVSTRLPQSGIIKFTILHIFDVNKFSIRIVQHIDSEGKTHDFEDRYVEILCLMNKLSDEKERKTVYDCDVGTICAYKQENLFHRCVVTMILERTILNAPSKVQIKLIDIGKTLKVSAYDLFLLPTEELADIPPQCVEVYIANIVPPEHDKHWSDFARIRAQKLLRQTGNESNEISNFIFVGRIKLQLENTLWLNNLMLREFEKAFSVDKLSIKNMLVKNKLVEENDKQLDELYGLCEKCNISLPDYSLPFVKPTKYSRSQATPSWAHLEIGEEYPLVYFSSALTPDQFFVRLCKYDKLLDNLIAEIQEEVKQEQEAFDVFEGRCYLGRDPKEDQYARVIVNKIVNNIANCFFVDYGDWLNIPVPELKFLSDYLLTKLPFQLIECSLYGVNPVNEVWSEEAIDMLYDFAFEPNENILRNLNVKVIQGDFTEMPKRKMYSVILFDPVIDKLVINKQLIEKNLAVGIDGQIIDDIDFETFNKAKVQEKEIAETDGVRENAFKQFEDFIKDNQGVEEIKRESDLDEEEKTYDCVFSQDTLQEFIKEAIENRRVTPAYISKTGNESVYEEPGPPIVTAPGYHTPAVKWSQDARFVVLKIQLPGVTNYKANLDGQNVFKFSTLCQDKEYRLQLDLFGKVEREFKHSSRGLYIYVKLRKCEDDTWERLSSNKRKLRNVIYDVDSLSTEAPKPEKKVTIPAPYDETDLPEYQYWYGSDFDYDSSDVQSSDSDND